MPKKPGSWELNEVKNRLGLEQVARERAATARYRQLEEREGNRGKTGWSDCLLLVLALSCFLLTLAVLALSSAVLSLTQR
jgi:hypothetical protein